MSANVAYIFIKTNVRAKRHSIIGLSRLSMDKE